MHNGCGDKFSGRAMGSSSTFEIYCLIDMSYRLSDNINIETPNLEEVVQFYSEVLGLRISEMGNDWPDSIRARSTTTSAEAGPLDPSRSFS
jgi:hypothetical protein